MKVLEWVIEQLSDLNIKLQHAKRWDKLNKLDSDKDTWQDVREAVTWDVQKIITKHLENEIDRKVKEALDDGKI